jgi:tetratricopeptide (TPR) repeat protein
MSLTWLGEAYEGLGDPHQATEQYDRSLMISRGNGDSMGIIIASNHLGRTCLASGEYGQAGLYLRDALQMAAEIQFLPLLIDTLASVAALLSKTGYLARARNILSLILDHPAGDPQIKKRIAQVQTELRAGPAAASRPAPELTLEAVVADLLAAETWLEKAG